METINLNVGRFSSLAIAPQTTSSGRNELQTSVSAVRVPGWDRARMSVEFKPQGGRCGRFVTMNAVSTDKTIPEQAELSQHPLDPHKPSFSRLLPEFARPYPSFEGWYTRLWDAQADFSVGIIMATNYATKVSQVTLLFTPASEDVVPGDDEYELRTYAVADMSKEASFKDSISEEEVIAEPVGFEWEAPGLGRLKVTANSVEVDMEIKGYKLRARLGEPRLWDADQSEKGPEGWARHIPIPTHWYAYSLGSKAEYEFSGRNGKLKRKGSAYGHLEKNWGLTFPNGHVWFQAFSRENDAQLLGSIAYFILGEVKTPYIAALGYRSPVVSIDMRTNDASIFKDRVIRPLEGEFSITGVNASHTIKIHAKADYKTLCEPILAPMAKVKWESACRETFQAEIRVEVYEHAVWGIVGDDKLIDSRTLTSAGLEFGEDLMQQALQEQSQNGHGQEVERPRAIDQ